MSFYCYNKQKQYSCLIIFSMFLFIPLLLDIKQCSFRQMLNGELTNILYTGWLCMAFWFGVQPSDVNHCCLSSLQSFSNSYTSINPLVKLFAIHWNSALLGNVPIWCLYLTLRSLEKYMQFAMTLRHHLQLVIPNTYPLTLLNLLHLDILFIMGVIPLAVISTLDSSCQKIWVGSWGNSSLSPTPAKNCTKNVLTSLSTA